MVSTNRLRGRWRRWFFDHLWEKKKKETFCRALYGTY